MLHSAFNKIAPGRRRCNDVDARTSVGCRASAKMPGWVVLCSGKLPLRVKEAMASGVAVPSGMARLRRPDDSWVLVCNAWQAWRAKSIG